MNIDVFKMQIGGIKSLSVVDNDNVVSVVMKNSNDPIFSVNKQTQAMSMDLSNFKGSNLDFGLLMMAISNMCTQGGNASMQTMKHLSTHPKEAAYITEDGKLVRNPKSNVDKDSLQLVLTRWIMSDFTDSNVDPLVGLIGLARIVEKDTTNALHSQAQNEQSGN